MRIENLVRENIKNLEAYTSARDLYKEGIFMDANENPLGSVVSSNLELNRYPDPDQKRLREKLSTVIGTCPENLFFGVGSDEIIDLLIRIFCNPGLDNIITIEPSYGMYEVCANINNVCVKKSTLDEDFNLNYDDIINKADKNTKLVFLCSPNNPTGNLLSKNDILKLCDEINSIIVVDEAYIDFTSEKNSLIKEIENYKNLVILRTFSKAWGLAGVRCGFSIACEEITKLLFKVKAPYTINKLTENAIINALDNVTLKNKFVDEINREKKRLITELESFEFIKKIYPSVTNYFLIKVDKPVELQKLLADKGIIIRNRSNQKLLSGCLRITVGTVDENNLLLKKMEEVKSEFNYN